MSTRTARWSKRFDQPDRCRTTRIASASIDAPFQMPSRNCRAAMPTAHPSPADALKRLGKEIDSSIRFYEKLGGPLSFSAR